MTESVLAQLCCALWLNSRARRIPMCKPENASLPDGPGIF
jgi:hypothetical protein